jgi:hypothetical protein
VSLGDLAQALPSIAVLEDRTPVDVERPPADMPAFQPGAAHPRPYSLDDEVPFEFGDSSDDDDDGPPERAAGIKIFAEANKFDTEIVELVQHLEEVANRPGDPVGGPDQHDLEATAPGIPQQIIETRAASFGSGDPVGVLGDDLKTPLPGHRAKIVELGLRVLVYSRYSQIQGNSFHFCSSIKTATSRKKFDSRSS